MQGDKEPSDIPLQSINAQSSLESGEHYLENPRSYPLFAAPKGTSVSCPSSESPLLTRNQNIPTHAETDKNNNNALKDILRPSLQPNENDLPHNDRNLDSNEQLILEKENNPMHAEALKSNLNALQDILNRPVRSRDNSCPDEDAKKRHSSKGPADAISPTPLQNATNIQVNQQSMYPSTTPLSDGPLLLSAHSTSGAGAVPEDILRSAPSFAQAAKHASMLNLENIMQEPEMSGMAPGAMSSQENASAQPVNLSQEDLDLIVGNFPQHGSEPSSMMHSPQPHSNSPNIRNFASSPLQHSTFSTENEVLNSENLDTAFDEREVEVFLSPCAQRNNRRSDVPPIGKRICIEEMFPVENPLEKDGRNTVIRGRLPEDNPFAKAANSLGVKLFCFKQKSLESMPDEDSVRSNHLKDVFSFGIMTRGKKMKVPVIGGDHLNVYRLQREVLLLGGVKNVVENRAFRIVAQQLELPGSCTSAAYVLKGTYERYLYHYEQLIVFGYWPKKPNEVVNMKTIVNEGREIQAKAKAKHKTAMARKRKSLEYHMTSERIAAMQNMSSRSDPDSGQPSVFLDEKENPPPQGVTPSNAETLKKFMAISSANPIKTWNLYCELTSDDDVDVSLPPWGLHFPIHGSYENLLTAALQLEQQNKVSSKCDIILLAVAECFVHEMQSDDSFAGLGLARLICCFSSKVRNGRTSQGLLFILMINILNQMSSIALAKNSSGIGLLDGIFAVMHNQCQAYTRDCQLDDPKESVGDTQDQDEAACFCALQVLLGLTKEPSNCPQIAQHKFFLPVCHHLLRYKWVPRHCLQLTLEIMLRCEEELWVIETPGMNQGILEGLLKRLEQSAAFDERDVLAKSDLPAELPDFEVSSLVLKLLNSFSSQACGTNPTILQFVRLTARLLHSLDRITDMDSLSDIASNLVGKFSLIVSCEPNFITGLFELLRFKDRREMVTSLITKLHHIHPLTEFSRLLTSMCRGSEEEDEIKEEEKTISTDSQGKARSGTGSDGHISRSYQDPSKDEVMVVGDFSDGSKINTPKPVDRTSGKPPEFEDVLAMLEHGAGNTDSNGKLLDNNS